MKLYTLFLFSHAAASAGIAAIFVIAFQFGNAVPIAVASLCSFLVLILVSWFMAVRIQAGLSILESAVTDHEGAKALHSGLTEFDETADRLGGSAERWESVAANTRQQARELQSMLSLLNRRGLGGEPSSAQLRDLLAGLGNTLHSQLTQIERGTAEIEQYTRAITDGSEAQGHTVIKTTAYVEQLSSTIDSVSSNAALARSAIDRTGESASAALALVREQIVGMKRVHADSEGCEKKLRGLCDPTQQIGSIVGTISDIAARTDLLALNASIESIRAGEHGRGFAIVADEVRRLAEQASDATREITSLIDSIQIVTQESIRGIERQREQVDSEVGRAVAAEQALQQICGTADRDTKHIRQITDAANQQLQLAQDVVIAIEQISGTAKANRSSADSVCWTMKSLSKTTPQFTSAIDRLRKCGGSPTLEYNDVASIVAPSVSTPALAGCEAS